MIQKLRIENFKCFKDQTLNFGRLTLLTGPNGTGKSTAIQPLLLLRQSFAGLRTGNLVINGDLVKLGTGKDILCESVGSEESIRISVDFQDDIKAMWDFKYDTNADVLSFVQPEDKGSSFSKSINSMDLPFDGDGFYYLSADRIGPRASYPMSEDIVVESRQLGPRGEYTAHFLAECGQRVIDLKPLARDEAQSLSLIHQVESWMRVLCPGVRLTPEVYRGVDQVRLGFGFDGEYGPTNSYRSANVGFGLTYVLPVIVAILACGEGSMLILENPEGHLHPRGQLQIAQLLAHAAGVGVQVIVETHSDHVLNGLRLAVVEGKIQPEDVSIHYFEQTLGSTEPNVVSPSIDRNGRLDCWPKGFFDEWENALDRLLGAESREDD